MAGFSSPDNIAAYTQKNLNIEVIDTPENQLQDVYQLDRCISWIIEHNYQRTCLQLPDKLLNDGISIALYLENLLKRTFYVLADTAYGSCCVDHISAEHVNGDSVIHFGHACLSPFSKLPVLYIFEKVNLNILKLKNAIHDSIPSSQHIIIFYDDIYHHLYNELLETFKDQSNVEISRIEIPECCELTYGGSRKICGRIFKAHSENTLSAIFIGEECTTFQNLALSLTDVKWYQFDKNEILKEYGLNQSKFLMKKFYKMELVKDANVLGILIGTLGIENYLDAIERVKLLAKERGKKCYILAVGRPNIAKLANFPEIDVFVSIACRESVSKDFKDYYKPVVSLFEAEMALGNHSFSTKYTNDFREVLATYSERDETQEHCEADVSLTSGKLRTFSCSGQNDFMALSEKIPGIIEKAKGAEYLSNRSWKGLGSTCECKDIVKAEMGLSGIPMGYKNEYDTLKKS